MCAAAVQTALKAIKSNPNEHANRAILPDDERSAFFKIRCLAIIFKLRKLPRAQLKRICAILNHMSGARLWCDSCHICSPPNACLVLLVTWLRRNEHRYRVRTYDMCCVCNSGGRKLLSMIMGKLLSKDRSISVAVDSYLSSFFGHQKIYSYHTRRIIRKFNIPCGSKMGHLMFSPSRVD